MDGYLRLGMMIVAAIILLGILLSSRKRPAATLADHEEEVPMVFSDVKDDFEQEFLMKSEPHIEEQQLSLSLEEADIKSDVHEKSFNQAEQTSAKGAELAAPISNHPGLVTLAVMAKPGNHFASYDLLQAIYAAGLQFGDMNIFHYHQQIGEKKVMLFSLASANEPGEFNLDNIGDFSCSGLILFLKFSRVSDPQTAFEIMFEAAEHLAEDLDGIIKADPITPWTEDMAKRYQQRIMQVQHAVEYV